MNPEYLIVHTAAFEGEADVETVRQWHIQRGFTDIGYHFYIRRSGLLQEGRSEYIKGAHCRNKGMNSKSLGICLEGHHNLEDWTPEQEFTFESLAKHLMEKYSIPVHNVLGHRETGANKDCPGTRIDMDEVRNKLKTLI